MKYNYILFDLDGTLTDPCEGITKSVQYALLHFGIKENNMQKLTRFIGPPLKEAFSEYYGLSEKDAQTALNKYRERFSTVGWKENILLCGAKEILQKLKSDGCTVCLATSKPHVFAKQILEMFDIKKYFDVIVGSELDGTRTDKAQVISFVMEHFPAAEKSEFIMIGDRSHDIIGAKKNNIFSCGVLCGYGSKDELENAGADCVTEDLNSLYDVIKQ